MKKPSEKKKTVVPPKKTGQGKRTAVKKAGAPKAGPKEDVKRKTESKPPSAKEKKKAARPSVRSAEKTAKPSRAKKAGEGSPKKAGKVSPPTAKTTSRKPSGKKTPPKTAPKKTAEKKQAKKPAGRLSSATGLPAAKVRPPKPGGRTTRRKAVGSSKPVPWELPREYGQNEVILMSVDPHVIFVDWEVTEKEVPADDIPITLRVFDVTSDEGPSEPRQDRFFDLPLGGRVGSGFFEIRMPGRQIAVEIGFTQGGHFSPVVRSERVSMPDLLLLDDLGISQQLFDSWVPFGY